MMATVSVSEASCGLEAKQRVHSGDDLSWRVMHDLEPVGLSRFEILSVLGEGGFAKVLLARKRSSDTLHAIKVIKKSSILKGGSSSIRHLVDENEILKTMRHPFVLTLQYAFQDDSRLYLVTNYVGGGDMHSLLDRFRKFPESWAVFYAAQLTSAIMYVHGHSIVFRDLKPANVLIGLDGYIVLADFGLAKKLTLTHKSTRTAAPVIAGVAIGEDSYDEPRNSVSRAYDDGDETDEDDGPRSRPVANRNLITETRASTVRAETFCGTALYLAPEVVCRSPYGRSVDWWTLGCVFVEMLTGLPPFMANDVLELMEKIKRGVSSTLLSGEEFSPEARSFALALLVISPQDRLGCGPKRGGSVTDHAVFNTISWDKLIDKEIEAPFLPDKIDLIGGVVDKVSAKADVFKDAFVSFALADEELLNASGCSDHFAKLEAPNLTAWDTARSGDLDDLKRMIASGVDVNRADLDKRTICHLAAVEGHFHIIAYAIEKGADINMLDRWGGSPLAAATREGHSLIMELLLQEGATQTLDVAAQNAKLCESVRAGDLLGVRAALAGGADLKATDYDKRTPLHLAASEGRAILATFLIDKGADVNAKDRWASSALDDAEREGHADVISILRAAGAIDLDASSRRPDEWGVAAPKRERRRRPSMAAQLGDAARAGDLQALNAAILMGADVNARDHDQRTPLHLAAVEGHAEVVRALVKNGADVYQLDRWGGSALTDAEREGRLDVIPVLRAAGSFSPTLLTRSLDSSPKTPQHSNARKLKSNQRKVTSASCAVS